MYKFATILKGGVLRILTILGGENLGWRDIRDGTKLPIATLNRSLSKLKDLCIIAKEGDFYRLTWAGKSALDGLSLLDILQKKETLMKLPWLETLP